MKLIAASLAACAALVSAAPEAIDTALAVDDQCIGGEESCVLNALQLKGQKTEVQELLEAADEEEEAEQQEDEEESGWLKDITTATKNHFKKILAPLQKPIVANYQYLTELEKFANYTMLKIENATGSQVIWNRKSLLQEDEEEELEATYDSTYGRRRRSTSKDLPPRARYINKILIYLDKEMEAVWNYNTIIDRKRWGVGNVITSSPFGPHGEHPERWRANGSFPFPVKAPSSPVLNVSNSLIMHIKGEKREYSNKYAQQLAADYHSMIANINDASKKGNDLRARLYTMDAFTDKFIALPSGAWSKIDAQT